MAAGRRSKCSSISPQDLFVGNPAGAKRLDHDRDWPRLTNGVGNLNLKTIRQSRGDDILGHVAGGIGRGAVDFRGVLPGKRTASVAGHAAVRIDDDLAPGQARVGDWTADLEPPTGIDQDPGFIV